MLNGIHFVYWKIVNNSLIWKNCFCFIFFCFYGFFFCWLWCFDYTSMITSQFKTGLLYIDYGINMPSLHNWLNCINEVWMIIVAFACKIWKRTFRALRFPRLSQNETVAKKVWLYQIRKLKTANRGKKDMTKIKKRKIDKKPYRFTTLHRKLKTKN